jgi:hypothetical protein
MANEEFFTLNQKQDFLIPIQDRVYGVKEGEWKRLKKLIERCKLSTELWTIIASASFGVAGSALVGWLTLYFDDGQASNVKLLCVMFCMVVIGVIVGGLCLIFHFQRKEHIYATLEDIKEEMKVIEDAFIRSGQ